MPHVQSLDEAEQKRQEKQARKQKNHSLSLFSSMNTVKKTIISPKPKLRITEELPVNQERQLTPYELLSGVTVPNV